MTPSNHLEDFPRRAESDPTAPANREPGTAAQADSPAASNPAANANPWRFLTNNNPFYLISAGFVVYGVRRCFSDELDVVNMWLLMGLLSGYALLVAAAGGVIVRWGKMWEDARSIFLVLLLLMLSISVSFDDLLLTEDGRTGFLLILMGFAVCVAVTEALLWGLAIRFPAVFRVPYYLLLTLLYWYPLVLNAVLHDARLSAQGGGHALTWCVLLFSILAGAAMATLIPGARRGREAAKSNGTPWSWPWFPMPLFLFLALGVGWRIYALGVSFGVDANCGAYFLIPFLLSCAAVVLELGLETRNPWPRTLALLAPVGLAWLS
ncbi:MAG: hypothetical protein N2C14_07940, partial [Planctomycetales bacterium]